jgi:transposase
MLGIRSPQRGLFEADHLYLEYVGRDSFYGFLASQRGSLFDDEAFAKLYCLDNGRTSVPPSVLATALLLQTYDRVSDEEAKARADFDLRWKVALGIGLDERPFAKSTLQVFRAQLIVHEEVQAIFKEGLTFARRAGHLTNRKINVALDTSNILGRGAVKDTYNLLADGIVKLGRVLAALHGGTLEEWASAHNLAGYVRATSPKGEASIDWDDQTARQRFLTQIVADADHVGALAREALTGYPAESPEHAQLTDAADLLAQILLQDVTRAPEGASIKEGVAPDRIVSVHDPEMRHGRKSASKRFDGHKVEIAVDTDSQLITAVTVLPGNAPDSTDALKLVEQSEENAGVAVEETIGDCAYGDGATRQEFAGAGRLLIAKVPARPQQQHFPKEDFRIDLATPSCTCPAGQATQTLVRAGTRRDRDGTWVGVQAFQFDAAVCGACPLHDACVAAGPGKGRTVTIHPQEALLRDARAFQRSDAFVPYRKLRQVAEHRIARLMQLGVRQARYVGRVKTLYQALMAATVANLTLVATKTGLLRGRNSSKDHLFTAIQDAIPAFTAVLVALITSITARTDLTRQSRFRMTGFRPGF